MSSAACSGNNERRCGNGSVPFAAYCVHDMLKRFTVVSASSNTPFHVCLWWPMLELRIFCIICWIQHGWTSVNFSVIVVGSLTWDVQMSISTKIWGKLSHTDWQHTLTISWPSCATQDAQTSPRNADDEDSVSVLSARRMQIQDRSRQGTYEVIHGWFHHLICNAI